MTDTPRYRPIPIQKDGITDDEYQQKLRDYVRSMNEALGSLHRAQPGQVMPGAIDAMSALRDEANAKIVAPSVATA